ncbi:MAG: hypothetical protein ACE5EZ_06735, partial [Thermodesulfobacteriota bacterium]
GHGSVRLTDVTEALGLMDRTVLLELMGAIISKDGGLSLNIIEKIYNFGYDLKKACGELLAIVRDITAIKVTGGVSLIEAPAHELEALREISAGSATEDLHMLFLLLQKGYEDVARSDFARHAFEMTVLRASSFDSLRPLDELVRGMKNLGQRQGGDFSPSAAPQKGPAASLKGPQPSKKRPGSTGPGSLATTGSPKNGSLASHMGEEVSKRPPAALQESAASANDSGDLRAREASNQAESHGAAPGREVPHGVAETGPSWKMEKGAELGQGVLRDSGAGPEAGDESNETAAVLLLPEARTHGAEVARLMGHLKENNISLYGSLKTASIDLRDNLVEIKTDFKTSKFLKMQLSRLEGVFSEYLQTSVKVVLKAELADPGKEKDPADEVLKYLGGKVLEDSYGDGG